MITTMETMIAVMKELTRRCPNIVAQTKAMVTQVIDLRDKSPHSSTITSADPQLFLLGEALSFDIPRAWSLRLCHRPHRNGVHTRLTRSAS